MNLKIKAHLLKVFVFLIISSLSFAQSDQVMNSSNLKLSLDKLNVLGSVLYVAAHPDDENNALLAYFAKGKLLRTGYISLTRGDGGQNLVGTEQGDMLGVLRTQELLAARRIDGAQQFFSRAIDFGYSKSAKETLHFWGKKKILSDMVWVIRKFRPDIIITRFHGTKEDGHGNHIASEILAAEAFKISGDPTKFPEQLKYVKPWKAKRIVWNAWPPILERHKVDLSKLVKIDVGSYNPLLGESYTQIGAKARSMHKSQGFGSSPRLGDDINYFEPTDGPPAKKNLFEGINLTWSRISGGEKVGQLLKEADEKFDAENPSEIIPILLKAYNEIKSLKDNFWVPIKEKELLNVIRSCAGISIEATASDYSAAPGESVNITSDIINRSEYPFILKRIKTTYQKNQQNFDIKLTDNKPVSEKTSIQIPANAEYSQPYWLREPHGLGDYVVKDQRLIGKPENDPVLQTEFFVELDKTILKFSVPVYYRHTDPVKGEVDRNFVIVPPVAINIGNKDYLFPDSKSKTLNLTLIANTNNISGTLKFDIPSSWKIEPLQKIFHLKTKGDELSLNFVVYPSKTSSDVKLTAEAVMGNKVVKQGMVTIDHSYFPEQTLFPPSSARLIKLNIKKVINNIGYVMGPGDKIPGSLRELGYNVTMLSDKDIENGNLSKFDAIITGIRLYNTDKQMEYEQPKLLKYVKDGGTLVVQYNKNFGLVTDKIGPYPFHISRKRVTNELAKVTFLDPNSPLLNFPNKITEKDFNGWVQERGVYFPDKWDPKYKTVLACHDPGEEPLDGGLLYTKYGKGIFIYTGYDWFRELPAGVPGAFRFYVNLISAGKNSKWIN